MSVGNFLIFKHTFSDTRINIDGYSLLRADHPNNTKRGGFCMYYKIYLPVLKRTDLPDLQECLVAEVTVHKERCFFNLHRSPNQNDDEFEMFCSDLTFLLNNIKGATKFYFMYCSSKVIFFFSSHFYRSAFSTYSLVKLVLRLFAF